MHASIVVKMVIDHLNVQNQRKLVAVQVVAYLASVAVPSRRGPRQPGQSSAAADERAVTTANAASRRVTRALRTGGGYRREGLFDHAARRQASGEREEFRPRDTKCPVRNLSRNCTDVNVDRSAVGPVRRIDNGRGEGAIRRARGIVISVRGCASIRATRRFPSGVGGTDDFPDGRDIPCGASAEGAFPPPVSTPPRKKGVKYGMNAFADSSAGRKSRRAYIRAFTVFSLAPTVELPSSTSKPGMWPVSHAVSISISTEIPPPDSGRAATRPPFDLLL